MTREHLETAIRERIPFVIKMADGQKYAVTDRYQVALGKNCVALVDKRDLPHILPMLSMTGIAYLKRAE